MRDYPGLRPVPHEARSPSAKRDERAISNFADLPPEAILRRPLVETLSGFARSTLYHQINAGKFPAPQKLTGGHAVGWRVGDVRAWLQDPAGWRAQAAQDLAA